MGAIRSGLLLVVLVLAGMTPRGAAAADRVALVIGNGSYKYASQLINPRNDATDMAATLRSIGFEVVEGFDLTKSEMDQTVREFARAAAAARTVIFFYAGHGMQVNGTNYLLPTDAQLQDSSALDFETVELDRVTRNMQGPSKTSLIFLDACRNNPLTRNFAQAVGGSRAAGLERGLAPTSSPGDGLFIAYATAPNDVALDGTGRNSPFTSALLRYITSPSLEIQQVMTRVKAEVHALTDGRQRPWHNSDLRAEVFLARSGQEERSARPLDAAEEQLWAIVDSTASRELAEIFLQRYPDSAFAPAALRILETPDLAEPAPAPPPVDTALLKPESPPIADEADDQADFSKASNIATRRAWNLFLTKHPSSDLAASAREMRDAIDEPASKSAADIERSLSLSRDQRVKVQAALSANGFDAGEADGSFGARTRSRLAEFQRARGLGATGYLDSATASYLGLQSLGPETFVSSHTARLFDPADLAGLETDARILKAAECLSGLPIIYGAFAGRIYVAVLQRLVTVVSAQAMATKCNAHVVSIGSREENDFVYAMIEADKRLFKLVRERSGSFKAGPIIGLRQERTAAEPRQGWGWANGEGLAYSNWGRGMPDDYNASEDYAAFWASGSREADPSDLKADKWNDISVGMMANSFVLEFD